MEKLLELLAGVTEETSIEEARRIILDVSDALEGIRSETEGFKNLVNEQQTEIDNLHAEIARLKEENGRIYRERAETIQKNIDEKLDEVTDKTDAEIEQELIDNIDI